MTIGYLGPQSSFTHQAAQILFGKTQLHAFPSIPNCLQAVSEGTCDCGVVPIENSLEGSVHATIDYLFHKSNLQVIEEVILPIKQQLLVSPMTQLTEITTIMSHPQALAQSQTYLERHFPKVKLEAVSSTTAAAEYVRDHPEKGYAAIASTQAAARYQLTIVATNIQDNAVNQTRFWVVKKAPQEEQKSAAQIETGANIAKQTLLVTLPSNQPGALHQILAAFGWRKIGLSKIESRPLKTHLGEYFFVIDLVCEQSSRLIANALEEITLLGATVRNLGAYPVTTITDSSR